MAFWVQSLGLWSGRSKRQYTHSMARETWQGIFGGEPKEAENFYIISGLWLGGTE